VVAAQWSWQFEYPEYGVSASELHLPVNRPVLLKLNAVDVIHSFWVPEFRVKQDAVPGMETVLRLTPSREGSYTLLCAELCGLLHAYMTAPVSVEGEQDFLSWVQKQKGGQ
jgi:cytochrome c oxidase subunit 2